jgi:AraC-like DNA-binding protein
MDHHNRYRVPDYKIRVSNYFTVSPAWNAWGPRVIRDHELIYQVQGNGYYTETRGTKLVLAPHQVLLVPPKTEHVFSCEKSPDAVISCIHFTPTGFSPPRDAHVYSAAEDAEILQLFRKCAREFETQQEGHAQVLNQSLAEILLRFRRLKKRGGEAGRAPLKVRQALYFIGLYYKKDISRQDIAAYVDVTGEHLNFLFRRHLRTTPMEHLGSLRMREAKLLLKNEGWNVSQVAREVGYEDPLYFSRVFRQATGISPREYARML